MHSSNIDAPQRTEILAFLGNVALFRDVPQNELLKLASLATIETFEADALILLEGEATNDLLIIGSGTIEVYVSRAGQKVPITTLGPTAYFGEMSVFDDYPRSAYVRAVTDVLVYRFDRDSFREFLKAHPATLYQMCTVFSHRLRNTNTALAKH